MSDDVPAFDSRSQTPGVTSLPAGGDIATRRASERQGIPTTGDLSSVALAARWRSLTEGYGVSQKGKWHAR